MQTSLDAFGRLGSKVPGGVERLELPRHQVNRLVVLAFGDIQFVTNLPQGRFRGIDFVTCTSNQVDRGRFVFSRHLDQQAGRHPWYRLESQ